MLMDNSATFHDVDVLSIMEASFDGLMLCDAYGKTVFVNSAAERIMGIMGSEFVGHDSIELQRSGVITHATSMETLRTGKPFTVLQTYKNGNTALVSSNVVYQAGQKAYVIINIRDVTVLPDLPMSRGGNTKDTPAICNSQELKKVFEIVRMVARTEATVLLMGETGVGKDVVARRLHVLSSRVDKPFVKVNCGTLPEHLIESELFGYDSGAFTGAVRGGKAGLVECADKGTLFLDEIAELPMALQPKLLELLQDFKFNRVGSTTKRSADIRVIASTNKDLVSQVEKGLFRADLYYRLNVIPIEIPPLRQRADDIIPLVENYLRVFNQKYQVQKRIDRETYPLLVSYAWPGNIRELENTIERLVVTTCRDTISRADLPNCLVRNMNCLHTEDLKQTDLKSAVHGYEKELISQYLGLGYSTEKIGQLLGVSQPTVSRKLARYFPVVPGTNLRER
ncbi:MAG: hypothetical protein CVV52_09185 [Spirochaetae bacterium HGW-Spirochaetae-8]|nr:MAG: hypothetical protein CVV52_09185 [Spirochaetae bacterium HGW-Spirochaetae-8]